MNYIKALGFGLLALIITGCATKQNVNLKQTALFLHNKIYKDLSTLNIDMADDDFTSLEIEYPNSKFIPIDLLILYKAHLENSEFELATFYIDEYEKRYATDKSWCEYTKIKIQFDSLQNPYTNQKKIIDLLNKISTTQNKYPNSKFNYELNTIKTKLQATQIVLDNQISKLYTKLNKPKSAKMYKKEQNTSIIPPIIPWYKKMFYW